ncbi:hypothetical protein F2P44_18910 [Massilia sp. CCM 8695]|uniref:ESPR domain-containing protein n=1 Tax=Massilia frigida TaxID=2609281 RepID=A0ABX0N7G9_9BURK|nr:hypothetical protein [Massilia frigida]NHZ81330.1 hypothetical protein [Massilia frigida]
MMLGLGSIADRSSTVAQCANAAHPVVVSSPSHPAIPSELLRWRYHFYNFSGNSYVIVGMFD